MKMISKVLLASVGAVVLAGSAFAAGEKRHVIRVAMPDGTVRTIHYRGDEPPRIILVPARQVVMPASGVDPRLLAEFRMMDRMRADVERRIAMMQRRAALLASQAGGDRRDGQVRVVSSSPMAPGTIRYSFVSSGNGGAFCSRSVRITSIGPDQPPKMVSQTSGNCSGPSGAAGRPSVSKPASDVKVPAPAKPVQQTVRVRDTV